MEWIASTGNSINPLAEMPCTSASGTASIFPSATLRHASPTDAALT